MVTNTKLVFQKQWRTTTPETALWHNSLSISKNVCFIHEMRCKKNYLKLVVDYKLWISNNYLLNTIEVKLITIDFKYSLHSECCILSLVWILGIWITYADVLEHSVCSTFMGKHHLWRWDSVPKCWHIKFRCWVNTQKKEYNKHIVVTKFSCLTGHINS